MWLGHARGGQEPDPAQRAYAVLDWGMSVVQKDENQMLWPAVFQQR